MSEEQLGYKPKIDKMDTWKKEGRQKQMQYSYSPEMYESTELNYTWKMYKGYNPKLGFYPDTVSYSLPNMDYEKFMDILINKLGESLDSVTLELMGHPDTTIRAFETETEKINEYGEIFYYFSQNGNTYTEYMLGISYSIDNLNPGNNRVVTGLEFLHPPIHNKGYDEKLLSHIKDSIKSSFQALKPIKKDNITISMLNQNKGGLYLEEFDISKQTTLVKEYDLFYGEGFKTFNDKLVNRFSSGGKGLVLFHGNPGTGKTYYIRSLIYQLQKQIENAIVVYTPISMIENLNGPDFLNLLNDNANKNIILLIEDAEDILVDRANNKFVSSISNILNSTSGILNDIFGISIIATFNSSIDKIDKALLRNERLMAIKDFKLRNKEDSIKIAEYLGVEEQFKNSKSFETKTEFSIADITANIESHEILEHNIITQKRKIGFGS